MEAGVLDKKRSRTDSGASSDKRQRLSGYASEIIESEESEALPENYAGEIKESDSDRRRREQEERKQKKREEAAERKRQGHANQAKSQTKPCFANIGGKRVEKNGIITFEGGETFEKWTKQEAEDATGILNKNISKNIRPILYVAKAILSPVAKIVKPRKNKYNIE